MAMSHTPQPPGAATRRRGPARRRVAPAASLALEDQLCFALYSTSLAMTKHYRPLLEALGLTYPQYLVMLALWQQDGPTVSDLGARVFLDSGTLTPLLKRLEAAALLQRRRASDDERRVVVELTTAGRALRRRAVGIPGEVARASGCERTDLVTLTATLQRLRATLAVSIDSRFPAAA